MRGVVLPLVTTWVLALLAFLWTFAVMMGHTTTQGGALPASAYWMAVVPAGLGLAASLWMLFYIHRTAGMGLAWWLSLVPVALLGYLTIAMLIMLLQGR